MSKTELIDQRTVENDYGIPIHTQNTWRSANRYGWRDLTIKLGRLIRYRRPDIERWLESRRLAPPISGGERLEARVPSVLSDAYPEAVGKAQSDEKGELAARGESEDPP